MQDTSFSLTRVRLRQYRSIPEADVALGPLVFLIGPNGSGKSNFLDALRLVSEGLRTSLDEALDRRGGVAQVRRRSAGHPTRFCVDLDFRGPHGDGGYGIQVAAVRGGGFRIVREHCAVRPAATARDGAGAAPAEAAYRVDDGVLTSSTEPGMPAADRHRLLLADLATRKPFKHVLDGLADIGVFTLNPEAMREPRTPGSGQLLQRDGSDIAGVLHRLGRSARGREDKARIESYLRQIVPGIHGVTRRTRAGREILEFTQDVPGAKTPWRFGAPSVSDGTLRALGVLTSLFTPAGGAYSTVAVEEPETALHPTATGALLAALRDASDRRQVIATSHSPDLLDTDEVDPAELLAVRAPGGRTVIAPLDAPATFALRAQLHTPGQLLRADQLLPHPSPPAGGERARVR
ncbi:AAA family ATPase [Streptomyces sp. CBMA29]|uniref:AAA family ATPase n=1 Tax=Streptomyces sp. CBMA29 TaxID=1896314 RepID=UPI001661B5DF|nr:ATP-binding protein [Streptomyces sp. CBMA29]MBD0739082.1 chromosome segregation protein SMC [Streptomyces sp. CBMA29]